MIYYFRIVDYCVALLLISAWNVTTTTRIAIVQFVSQQSFKHFVDFSFDFWPKWTAIIHLIEWHLSGIFIESLEKPNASLFD